jgi:hypothetical protein
MIKRILPISLLVLGLALGGCAWTERHMPWHHDANSTASKPTPAARSQKTIVTVDNSLVAKVLDVNTVARFVVLNFPEGKVPKLEQHLFLYRGGLKTAEVKVVGPQDENSIVADIISGEAQTGDTVRDQ